MISTQRAHTAPQGKHYAVPYPAMMILASSIGLMSTSIGQAQDVSSTSLSTHTDLSLNLDACTTETAPDSALASTWCKNDFSPDRLNSTPSQQRYSVSNSLNVTSNSAVGISSSVQGKSNLQSDNSDVQFRLPESIVSSEDDYQLDMRAEYNVNVGSVNVKPFGSARFSQEFNSNLPGRSESETSYRLGASVESEAPVKMIKPFASADFENTFSGSADESQSSDQQFNLGVGFEAGFSQRAKAFMSYENSISTDFDETDQQINAGFLFNF